MFDVIRVIFDKMTEPCSN